ncbi:MAG: demethoxyubiquinone hydroxylase family protein [Pseudomonadota bacterium]|nr:demethoxyubiquinone hydroxylase family protein [Pseudomonadota bacterium]
MSKTLNRLGPLPGDPTKEEMVERMLRVDQAGEFGAKRIYAGQIAVLGETDDGPLLREMAATEERHLERFNQLLTERGVRPTFLSPLWHVAGFALGASTALLGREAAMACTVAVEEVIEEHYKGQLTLLGSDLMEGGEPELEAVISEFRDDEISHKQSALAASAETAPVHPLLSAAVKTGSRLAIWLSERI